MTQEQISGNTIECAQIALKLINTQFPFTKNELACYEVKSETYQRYSIAFYLKILEYMEPWEKAVKDSHTWLVTYDTPDEEILQSIATAFDYSIIDSREKNWNDLHEHFRDLLPTVFDLRDELDQKTNTEILMQLVHLVDVANTSKCAIGKAQAERLLSLLDEFVIRLASLSSVLNKSEQRPEGYYSFEIIKHDKQFVFTQEEQEENFRLQRLEEKRKQKLADERAAEALYAQRKHDFDEIVEGWNRVAASSCKGQKVEFVGHYTKSTEPSLLTYFMYLDEEVFAGFNGLTLLMDRVLNKDSSDSDALLDTTAIEPINGSSEECSVADIDNAFEALTKLVSVIINGVHYSIRIVTRNSETGDSVKSGIPGHYKAHVEFSMWI